MMPEFLCSKIKNYQFLCSLVLWHDLLNRINIVSKMLQGKDTNLAAALIAINNAITYVKGYRSDKSFESLLETSKELARELEISPEFETSNKVSHVRKRKVKRQFDYEHQDEAPQDPKDLFKINFFYYALDVTMNSLEERYEQLKTHNSYFEF